MRIDLHTFRITWSRVGPVGIFRFPRFFLFYPRTRSLRSSRKGIPRTSEHVHGNVRKNSPSRPTVFPPSFLSFPRFFASFALAARTGAQWNCRMEKRCTHHFRCFNFSFSLFYARRIIYIRYPFLFNFPFNLSSDAPYLDQSILGSRPLVGTSIKNSGLDGNASANLALAPPMPRSVP